jgi:stearoyl-CoA desaturase (Delta-9 desaturase)
MRNTKKINWTNTIFFSISPIIAIASVSWLALHDGIRTPTMVFAFVLLYVAGLTITAGYHRLFSHKAYEACPAVKKIFLFLGSITVQGSVLEWCTDHRDHHLHTDTDKDPYDATKGFWFSHILWICRLDESERDFSNVKDLSDDPAIYFQHVYYMPLVIVVNFIMPMAIASLWGDPLGGLFIAGLARTVLAQHFTFFINSWAHIFGKQPYSEKCTAKDNWMLSMINYGEGFHNFHHQFAKDYRNGIRWFHYDPAKWLIFLLAKCHLASNLKRVPDVTITAYKLSMKALKAKQSCHNESLEGMVDDILDNVREKIATLYQQKDDLIREYQALQADKVSTLKKKMIQSSIKLNRLHQKMINQELVNTIKTYNLSLVMVLNQA